MRKPKAYKCSECGSEFFSIEAKPKFCSRSCSSTSGSRNRGPVSEETQEKMTAGLRKYWATQVKRKIEISEIGKNSQRGKRKQPKNLFNMSSRTREKVICRLNISCSVCGWAEARGDIHHIKGKKIDDPHDHSNLSYLCPNCHRLAHCKKLDPDLLVTFEEQVGDSWLKEYYG